MKRATVLILALLLVPAAGADAKFGSARVCGRSDCREVTLDEGHTLLTIEEAAFSARSRLTSNAPEASPWYRVTLGPGQSRRVHGQGSAGQRVRVPAAQGAAGRGGAGPSWTNTATDVYRRVTTGLEPFPASRLVAFGAAEPNPAPGEDSGSPIHIPAWGWIAIAAAAAVLARLSVRWLRPSRRSPLVR